MLYVCMYKGIILLLILICSIYASIIQNKRERYTLPSTITYPLFRQRGCEIANNTKAPPIVYSYSLKTSPRFHGMWRAKQPICTLLNLLMIIPVTRRLKGYTRFVEKNLSGRRNRFRRHKVYIFLIRITNRVDLAMSV